MLSPRAQSWNRHTPLPSEERFQNDLKMLEEFHTSLFGVHAPNRFSNLETQTELLREQADKIQQYASSEFFEKIYVSARLFANTLLQQEDLLSSGYASITKNNEELSLQEVMQSLQTTWFWRVYLRSEHFMIPKRALRGELSWFILAEHSLFQKQRPLLENWLQGFFSPYFSKKDPILFHFERSTWSWKFPTLNLPESIS